MVRIFNLLGASSELVISSISTNQLFCYQLLIWDLKQSWRCLCRDLPSAHKTRMELLTCARKRFLLRRSFPKTENSISNYWAARNRPRLFQGTLPMVSSVLAQPVCPGERFVTEV